MTATVSVIGRCVVCLARAVLSVEGGCRGCLRRFGVRFIVAAARVRAGDQHFIGMVLDRLPAEQHKFFRDYWGLPARELPPRQRRRNDLER